MEMDSEPLKKRFIDLLSTVTFAHSSPREGAVRLLDALDEELAKQALPVTLTPYR